MYLNHSNPKQIDRPDWREGRLVAGTRAGPLLSPIGPARITWTAEVDAASMRTVVLELTQFLPHASEGIPRRWNNSPT
jgi:hypothetical protein